MSNLANLAFLGHSTVMVELEGVRVLTDPVLLDRVPLLRRVVSPVDPSLHEEIDVAVISHLHLDHFDLPSLRLLGDDVRYVVPSGAAALLRREGFSHVEELAPGERTSVGTLSITATPAVHSGYRPPFGPRAMAVGYLLEGSTERVYFAGDTDLFGEMEEIGRDLDVALVPVWGWGPTLGPGHLDPVRAAEAVGLLRPRFAVPIHWGTLWPYGFGRVRQGRLSDPPLEFAERATERHPPSTILLTPPGSPVAIGP